MPKKIQAPPVPEAIVLAEFVEDYDVAMTNSKRKSRFGRELIELLYNTYGCVGGHRRHIE
jgi:hypothetical protein